MTREEILEKSREENKNQDLVKEEVFKTAGKAAAVIVTIMACLFYSVQIVVCGKFNYGFLAIATAVNAILNLFSGIKLKSKSSVIIGIIWLVATAAAIAGYVSFLINNSII